MGLLPRWLKNKLYLQVVSKIKDDRRRESAQIPKFDLKEKHITQTRLLESREALLHLLAKEGTVAEIGVNKGDFSERNRAGASGNQYREIFCASRNIS